jgi:multiple sugar transport system permease protein/raffinose/stachyose/melibiose transport system permease protein
MKKRFLVRHADLGATLFLVVMCILTYFPFYFMLITSLKTPSQMTHFFWQPTLPPQWRNYLVAWWQLTGYFLNTVTVTTISVGAILLVSSMSAFAFARYRFPGRQFLFMLVLVLLMVPSILTLVPRFVWVKQLGLLNTHWALILPYTAHGQVFAIYLMRSYFEGLPVELFEAAKVDGARMYQIYLLIALPLCTPILSIVAIMNTLSAWNDYIWPLVTLTDNSKRTITVGLLYFQGMFQTNYGPLFAGYVLASLPLLILFVFTMRPFVSGLTSGAIKM